MYAFIQPTVFRPRAHPLFPATCTVFVRGLPLRPTIPSRRMQHSMMQATDPPDQNSTEQNNAALPASTEYLDSLQENVTEESKVKEWTEVETEAETEMETGTETEMETELDTKMETESEAHIWWADAAIYLVLTGFAAVFSFNERRRLLAAFLALMTTPTITVTAWKALVRKWHAIASAERRDKQVASEGSAGMKWLSTDARIEALAVTASDRDISVIRALSALDSRLDALEQTTAVVQPSTSTTPQVDISAFSQAAELRALRTRVARLDTASAELHSRLTAAESARIDAEHAARIAETELRAARAADHALRIRLAQAEAKASRLTSLQGDLEAAFREIGTMRMKAESDARAREELHLSATDAESRASRFESLVESFRERVSPRRHESSERRDTSRRRNSNNADDRNEMDRDNSDSDQQEDRAFWRRELERKAGRLVPDSLIAEELRSSSSEASSSNWPTAALSGGTRPSRVDGLPADGGFAAADMKADTGVNSSADINTTDSGRGDSAVNRLSGTESEGTFAFSRDEFGAGDSPIGSLSASPEAMPLPAASEDASYSSSTSTTEDRSPSSSTQSTSPPQSTKKEQTENELTSSSDTDVSAPKTVEPNSLSTSTDAIPLSATDEAIPLPAADEAIPLPAADEAIPLPAADEAIPLSAADEAIPLPAADEAIPLPAANEAIPLPAANESTANAFSKGYSQGDSKSSNRKIPEKGMNGEGQSNATNVGTNADGAANQALSYLDVLEERREGDGNPISKQQKDVGSRSEKPDGGATDGEVAKQLDIKMVERKTEFVDADMTVKAVEMGESALEEAQEMENADSNNDYYSNRTREGKKARNITKDEKNPKVEELLRTAKELIKKGRRRGLSISKADGYFREATGKLEDALVRVEKLKGSSDNKGTSNLKSVVEGALGSCLVAWVKVNIADGASHERLERAKSLLQNRVDDVSDDTGALFSAGLCFCLLAATGEPTNSRELYEQACGMYERLLEVDEKSRIACFNCGLTYISLARLAAADNELSITDAERDWLQKATARFEKALQLKPDDSKAQAYVDDCRRQLDALSADSPSPL